MNTQQERLLRSFLAARDPGDAPSRLRELVAAVPYEKGLPPFTALDLALRRVFGPSRLVKPLLILVIVVALVVAAVGAALVQPWRPFPPRGLIAFSAPIGPAGTTGVQIVSADGTFTRLVTPLSINTFDHSPRWSSDGKTLLVARTEHLDPMGACGGVGSIVLYDVASGTQRVLASDLRPIDALEWSPSGEKIAFLYPPPGCNAPGELGVLDVASRQVTKTPLGDGAWQLRWTGESVAAVASGVTEDPQSEMTVIETPSHDDRSVATWTIPWKIGYGHLEILSRGSGATTDLGSGVSPAWSPDDTAIAYLQPGRPGGPTAVDQLRYPMTIVRVSDGQTRTIGEVLWPEDLGIVTPVFANGVPPTNALPPLFWTPDGSAIYWIDSRGGHVVDVVTGRSFDLPTGIDGCPDPQWQPTPP